MEGRRRLVCPSEPNAAADGAYTTWTEEEQVEWFEWRPIAAGDAWGVGYVTFAQEVPGAADAVFA